MSKNKASKCWEFVENGKEGTLKDYKGNIIETNIKPSELADRAKYHEDLAKEKYPNLPKEEAVARYLDEFVEIRNFKKIKNKFPKEALPNDGFITKYTMTSDGLFRFTNGNLIKGDPFNFIITKSGDLKIGNRHHFLGNREEVLAAGTIRFKNGRIVELDNLSGHYKPTIEEALNLKDILKTIGLPIKRAKYSIFSIKETEKGYIDSIKIVKTIFIDKSNIL